MVKRCIVSGFLYLQKQPSSHPDLRSISVMARPSFFNFFIPIPGFERLTLVAVVFFLLPPASLEATRIILDPGHGGRDRGTSWYGIQEKKLNLDVAYRVKRILNKRGYAVTMTRTSDRYVSLSQRARIANRYRNALFVSIHFNASTNRSATGIETYYYSSRGRSLAASIHTRIMAKIRTKNRGLKRKGFTVLAQTNCTAALVECGFLSNSTERKRCQSSWYRQTIAQAIADGIHRYRYVTRRYAKR